MFDINKSVEILAQTPKTLSNYISNLSDEWIYSNEGEKTWSPFDILGHLVHGEKTDWMIRIKLILKNKEIKTFEPFDRFAQEKTSIGKSHIDLLTEFADIRSANVSELKKLQISNKELNLIANHPALGKVTLQNLISAWVVHDLGHIAQIARVMSKQYKNEVGPWTEYLSILHK